MNSKFLFAKIAGLMVLAFGLYLAAVAIQHRINVIPASAPIAAVSPASLPQKPAPASLQIAQIVKPQPASSRPKIAANETVQEQSTPTTSPDPVPDAAPEAPDAPPVHLLHTSHKDDGVEIGTVPVYAGQELDISNSEYHYVEIQAETPILVKIGDCQATSTLSISCNNVAGTPILIQDVRVGTPFDSAPVNHVKIIVMNL